jgi:hypothetical protein
VFSRGDANGPYGHVGFFKGYDDQGNVLVLGGNQGDAVSISPYPRESLLGFRRAGEAAPQKFAEGGLAELTQKYDRGGEVPKPKRGEPETSSLTGFPEIDRMIVALGNVNKMFNPVEAIRESMDASKRMLAPDTPAMDRVAALGDMLSGVGGVVAPMAVSARAGTPAAAALMESLLGGSPTTTAMGDTAKDIGRAIVERANQRGPVPVMGSNFGNVLGGAEVTPGIEAADRIADMLRTGRADEITDELADQADPQRMMYHYTNGNTGMDLPMDYASRMERSKQMGFDTSLPLYHGTTTGDIKRFRLNPRTNDFAIYSAKDPAYANEFAGYDPTRPVSDLRLEEGSSVIPLFSKGEHGDFTMSGGVLDRQDVPNIAEMFGIDPQELLTSWDEIATESLGPNADVLPTYSFVENSPLFKERLEELGMSGVDFLDYSSSSPYDEFETWNRATLNPADLRSKFARFDPRLGHLSHLDYAKGGTVTANFNRDRQRDDLRTIGDTVYERRADGVLSPLSRVKYAASKPAEPETGSRTGFPEVDRMLVTLGNLNEALNPMVAIQNSQKASRRMFEPNISGWDRLAAAGDMLSNVAGVVAPAALSARAGVPAATALMESLIGGSPTMAAVGDTARDVGRKIVERANQRGPVPVMGSNFGNVLGDRGVTIANKGDNMFEVKVGGKPAGELSLSEGNGLFFMDDAMLSPEFRGKGVGSAAYDLVEKQLGERLVPSPRGLSDAAVSFWRKRLEGMDPTERATTLEYYGDALRGMGLPQKLIQQNLARLKPVTPEIKAADRVAELLRTGQEDEISEGLFQLADPQVLTRHYESGNTGMDMPMDYASRMARAKEQGFRGDLYSGTGEDFAAFDRNAVYATDNPDLAFTYAPTEGGNIIPLMMRAKYDLPIVEAGGANWNRLTPEMQVNDPKFFKSGEETFLSTRGFEREAKREGASGVTFNDIVDIGGYFNKHPSAFGAPDGTVYDNKVVNNAYVDYLKNVQKPSTVETRFYPNLVRSKFARFDPRLSHLGNLSAGVAAGAVGLEAAQYDPDQVDKIADTVRKREFATGGAVKYDPAAVENIINQIREVNRG